MSRAVTIDADYLDTLLWLAKRGDRAESKVWWQFWRRPHPVCSGDEREPECHSCQAFTAAEEALAMEETR